MRYYEILDEREVLGKKSEIQDMKTDRTFGFEFEIATSEDFRSSSYRYDDFNELIEYFKEDIRHEVPYEDWVFNEMYSNALELYDDINATLEPEYGFAEKKQVLKNYEDNFPNYLKQVREILNDFFENYSDNLSSDEKIKIVSTLFAFSTKNYDYYLEHNMKSNKEQVEKRSYTEIKLAYQKYGESYINSIANTIVNRLQNKLPENYIGSDDDIDDEDELDISKVYILDENDNIISLSDLRTYHELKKYFIDESLEDLKNELEHDYNDFINEEARKRAFEVIDEDESDDENGSGKIVSKASEVFGEYLQAYVKPSKQYKGSMRGSEWIAEPDSSIKPMGFELISPIFNSYNVAINNLETVLDAINSDDDFGTNESTGLHINIGNIGNIDFLKFILFIGEKYVTDIFNRFNNQYAISTLKAIKEYLSDREPQETSKSYKMLISELNDFINDNLPRQSFLNLNKLQSHGYIEIRGFGGKNYENKKQEITNLIKRILYVLSIAENPNAHRNEYLKKISKFLKNEGNDKLVNNVKQVPPFNVNETREIVKLYTSKDEFSDIKPNIKIPELLNSLEEINTFIMLIAEKAKNFTRLHQKILIKIINEQMKNNNNDKIKKQINVAKESIQMFFGTTPVSNEIIRFIEEKIEKRFE